MKGTPESQFKRMLTATGYHYRRNILERVLAHYQIPFAEFKERIAYKIEVGNQRVSLMHKRKHEQHRSAT